MTDTLYDPMRLQETIEMPNGATMTRIEGGAWTVEGAWEDHFPMRTDEGLRTDIRSLKKDLEMGTELDPQTRLFVPIDRARATFWLAMKEMTLQMRKEKEHEEEQAKDAAWERRCGVRG